KYCVLSIGGRRPSTVIASFESPRISRRNSPCASLDARMYPYPCYTVNSHYCSKVLITSMSMSRAQYIVLQILPFKVTHVVKILTSVEACDVLVPPLFCFVFRMPATACFSAHVTVHFAMAIERGIATKQMSTYERSDGRIGFIMAILSVIIFLGLKFQEFQCFIKTIRTVRLTPGFPPSCVKVGMPD
ncbi:unnamed protein product, partial [Haemonchus placei]|uniref:Transmembrane protein n=1 Tax=Haemonchus placei TaxID=6290 RepID=A0A0N4WAN6_HAEPC